MSRTASAVLPVPGGAAEVLARDGKLNSCTSAQLPERIQSEQARTSALNLISSSQKLPARNPAWQINAPSQVPEAVSGDLRRPHGNFHFPFTAPRNMLPASEATPEQNGS